MKVIRESYRAGESWPFFVTLERGEAGALYGKSVHVIVEVDE